MSKNKNKSVDLRESGRLLLKAAKRLADQEGEEAAVHRFRVQSRRLAMISNLSPGLEKVPGFKKALRKIDELRRCLGGIREIDVHLHLWEELVSSSGRGKSLEKQLNRERSKALRKILRKYDPKDMAKRVLSLLEKRGRVQVSHPSLAGFKKRFSKVLKAERRYENKCRLADLHRVRIALKKLRYSLEPLRGSAAERTEALRIWLKEMQGTLGRVHDLSTLQDALRKFRKTQVELDGSMKQELKSVSMKIQSAIDLGRKNWQKAWKGKEKTFRSLMFSFGGSSMGQKAVS